MCRLQSEVGWGGGTVDGDSAINDCENRVEINNKTCINMVRVTDEL